MRPTDLLEREHALVLRGLALLERCAARLVAEDPQAPERARELLAFFHAFLDVHHHAREEEELFPMMVEAGLPHGGGPVRVMLSEHDQGRALVGTLTRALSEPSSSAALFADTARAFSALLGAHIQKENGVLYPMALRIVPPAQLDALGQRWDAMGHAEETRWSAALDAVSAHLG